MESKRNEINWRSYFWKESNPGNLECTSWETRAAHEGGGRPLSRGPLETPPTDFFHPYIPTYPKTSRRAQ